MNALNRVDPDAESHLYQVVNLAAIICQTPIAIISLVDSERQVLIASKGIDITELPLTDPLLIHSSLQDEPLIVPDTMLDERTRDSVLNDPEHYGMRFFGSVPLQSHANLPIGMLCVIDSTPRALSDDQISSLSLLSGQVMAHIGAYRTREAVRRQHAMYADQSEELLQANHRLREANEKKDRFLAALSHELRNPLSAVRYGVATLQAAQQAETSEQTLQMISAQCFQLTRLLDDLLDVSRVDRGLIVLRRAPINLAEVIQLASSSVQNEAREKGQHLKIDHSERHIFVLADKTRLLQILVNLLTNAIRYTPAQGEIALSVDVSDQSVHIHVQDNGIGVDPADQVSIFSEFSQGNNVGDAHSDGLGLGLALVAELVRLHHGEIELDSKGVGMGSRFTVRLPMAATPSIGNSEPIAATAEPTPSPMLDILLVDDNYDSIKPLGKLLERRGYKCQLSVSGEQALEACAETVPDVVLVDISMPGMSGHEFARTFRQRYPDARTQLYAMSGHSQPSDRQQSTVAGFEHHLVKPLELEFLLLLLRSTRDQSSL